MTVNPFDLLIGSYVLSDKKRLYVKCWGRAVDKMARKDFLGEAFRITLGSVVGRL